jgi:hypothetical protein
VVERLTQRATQRTASFFMPKLPRTGNETHDSPRQTSTAGAIARAMGAPHLSGTATYSSQETFHGQARRQDRSHQRRHHRYRCGDRQALSIRRRDGSRYRLQRALGRSRQGGTAQDRGASLGRRQRGRYQSIGRSGQDQTRPHRRSFVNAGIAKFAPIAQVDEAFYDGQFNVNVKGAFFLLKHAIPIIPDGGAIILTASVAGAAGSLAGSTIYGSTKAALRSFGHTFAKELTPRGIRVNTISPGPIVTPILDKNGFTPAQKDAFIEGAKSRIPLGRTGTAAKSPPQPSTSPPMPPTPPAPNCSSTAA